MMLHKLRRAMVNATREPGHGEVEIDDTWIGGHQAGLRGSRQLQGRRAALVMVAVEKRGKRSGRVRMSVIPDLKKVTIDKFVARQVAAGSTIYSDGLNTYPTLEEAGYRPPAQPTSPHAVGKRRQVAGPAGRPCDRQPATVADRNRPRREPRPAPGLS